MALSDCQSLVLAKIAIAYLRSEDTNFRNRIRPRFASLYNYTGGSLQFLASEVEPVMRDLADKYPGETSLIGKNLGDMEFALAQASEALRACPKASSVSTSLLTTGLVSSSIPNLFTGRGSPLQSIRESTEAGISQMRAQNMQGTLSSTSNTLSADRDFLGMSRGNSRSFLRMPLPCPEAGVLSYINQSGIATAKANLAALYLMDVNSFGGMQRQEWASLVWQNVNLLYTAININPLFLFPKTTSRRPYFFGRRVGRYAEGDPTTTTLWTITGNPNAEDEAGQGRLPGLPSPENPYRIVGLPMPQAVVDEYESLQNYFWGQIQTSPTETNQIEAEANRLYTKWAEERRESPCTGRGNYATLMECSSVTRDKFLSAPAYRDKGSWGANYPWLLASNPLGLPIGEGYAVIPTTDNNDWSLNVRQAIPARGIYGFSTSYVYRNVPLELSLLKAIARNLSTLDVANTIADSVGFYVFNHNVFFASLLGKTSDQIQSEQQAAIHMRLASSDINVAITSVTAGVLTVAVGPLVAGIFTALNALSTVALGWLVGGALSPTLPYPLFIRVPPETCEQSITGTAADGPPAPPITPHPQLTKKKTNVAGPLVAVVSGLFLLRSFWK